MAISSEGFQRAATVKLISILELLCLGILGQAKTSTDDQCPHCATRGWGNRNITASQMGNTHASEGSTGPQQE